MSDVAQVEAGQAAVEAPASDVAPVQPAPPAPRRAPFDRRDALVLGTAGVMAAGIALVVNVAGLPRFQSLVVAIFNRERRGLPLRFIVRTSTTFTWYCFSIAFLIWCLLASGCTSNAYAFRVCC